MKKVNYSSCIPERDLKLNNYDFRLFPDIYKDIVIHPGQVRRVRVHFKLDFLGEGVCPPTVITQSGLAAFKGIIALPGFEYDSIFLANIRQANYKDNNNRYGTTSSSFRLSVQDRNCIGILRFSTARIKYGK